MWLNIPLSRVSDNITVIVIQEVLKIQYFNFKMLSKHPNERLLIRKRPHIQILNILRSEITCWFLSYFCLFVCLVCKFLYQAGGQGEHVS